MKSASWDHPRLCGEKSQHVRRRVIKPGSPPPMRGKATIFSCASIFAGITPAYAGKSVKSAGLFQCCEDHPRLCGEKAKRYAAELPSMGSPPPMRGKALSVSGCNRGCQDHPRLCGEKYIIDSNYNMVAGSPPPMRGKGGVNVKFSAQLRITPAYAGKRITCTLMLSLPQDHPRLCGEKHHARIYTSPK